MASDPLQTPFSLGGHPLAHLIVMAPMTRMRSSSDGIPNASAAEYYSERASSGGLLISEGIVIDPRGKGFPNTPGLWSEEQVEAWKPITAAVKAKGAVFFAQIWHVGRVSVPSQTGGLPPLSATKIRLPGKHKLFGDENGEEEYVEGEAMTVEDIHAATQQFARAARNAIRAGFDGVEIHGGNGYLLDTFVHSNINDRTDSYGGPLSNRLRFPLEVVTAVADEIGRQKTAIRIAPFHVLQETLDSDRLGTFSRYAEELEKQHLAYVHMVEPRYDQLSTEGAFSGSIQRTGIAGAGGDCSACPVNKQSDGSKAQRGGERQEYSLWTFRRILKTTPLIGAGGYDATSAREALHEGRVDLIALGRYFTSNPDLPARFFNDIPLTKYDRRSFYTRGEEGYLGWAKAEANTKN